MRADASTPWSDPAWAAIAGLLRERAGLVFTATRRPAAEGGMRRAMDSISPIAVSATSSFSTSGVCVTGTFRATAAGTSTRS